jgi:3-hydroxyisobutyrate dehydrogenase-like beta-hydroxyacid dehydrogenase
MVTTGFVGLGAMGGHMVRHLLAHKFAVSVYDTNADVLHAAKTLGAHVCGSAREVADRARVVMVCLPTPDIVHAVALGQNGVIEGKAVGIYVDHSTTGPSVAREVAAALAQKGIAALDGPLAGGVAGAEAGTLSVMAAGPVTAYREVEHVFKAFGRNVAHVGDQPGQGQVLKLINNMIVGTSLIASAEAVLFGVKSGLDAEVILKMLNVSTGRSFTTEEILGRRILERTFDFGFRMELMLKDLRLFVQESEKSGVPSVVNTVAKQAYEWAVAHGRGGSDMARVVEELEQRAGVKIARTAM